MPDAPARPSGCGRSSRSAAGARSVLRAVRHRAGRAGRSPRGRPGQGRPGQGRPGRGRRRPSGG
ncbi:hypothetical protein FCI23_52880 [Actinacidiphila oryziradicis]|uniref:Uncharacterized protein n=1 Tax=Actinacidiphila oryziradicis TaxID=2571141 RepID=A0A4U0RGZ7_9ACTN|nr:hypothetical protein FCI23_52880 [Actinacidiphila oryziradicis]